VRLARRPRIFSLEAAPRREWRALLVVSAGTCAIAAELAASPLVMWIGMGVITGLALSGAP
jgi:hypothetical protein